MVGVGLRHALRASTLVRYSRGKVTYCIVFLGYSTQIGDVLCTVLYGTQVVSLYVEAFKMARDNLKSERTAKKHEEDEQQLALAEATEALEALNVRYRGM